MKLYGDFDQNDWLKITGLKKEQIPQSLILHGEDTSFIFEKLDDWETSFHNPTKLGWNIRLGTFRGVSVAYANVFWAPMAANIAHKFCSMGTKRVIQTGYCGGLSPNFSYGSIYLSSSVRGEDGVSKHYSPNFENLIVSSKMLDESKRICTENKWQFNCGKIVSTSTMLLETKRIVNDWSKQGFIGVEGESAATFAVADKFGAEAIALLNCSDYLMSGDTVFETSGREELEDLVDQRIRGLALNLAVL